MLGSAAVEDAAARVQFDLREVVDGGPPGARRWVPQCWTYS